MATWAIRISDIKRYLAALIFAGIAYVICGYIEPSISYSAARSESVFIFLTTVIFIGFIKYLFLGIVVSPVFIILIRYILPYSSAYIVLFEKLIRLHRNCELVIMESDQKDNRGKTFIFSNVATVFGFTIILFKVLTYNVIPTPQTTMYIIESYFTVWRLTLDYIVLFMLISMLFTNPVLTRMRRFCNDLTVKYPSTILSVIPVIIAGIGSLASISLLFISIYIVFKDLTLSLVLTIYALFLGLGPITGFSMGSSLPLMFFLSGTIDKYDLKFREILIKKGKVSIMKMVKLDEGSR